MVRRNPHVAKLYAGYLFPEIIKRKTAFMQKEPKARLISLGIGDTTEPLSHCVAKKLAESASALSTPAGYSGYGPEEGEEYLRGEIANTFYQGNFSTGEIFISDGTNSDIGRLQILFGNSATIAVQDPSYPAYVDTNVILGNTSTYDTSSRKYGAISYMPCLPENQFFPVLSEITPASIIYFCSPNNPTGATATKQQLEQLVAFATHHKSIIIYDTAYASYIQDRDLPRSIYEIKGARQVAIELGSFSKMAGFTGVRLAWSVVPNELQFEDGHSVQQDWNRVHATFFNGASNISQKGGMAALTLEGQREIQNTIRFYMENAAIIRSTMLEMGYEVYGGDNAPYLWIKFPGFTSWEAFDLLLEKAHIVTAPGSGFGPGGEGFLRFSAFGKRENIIEAAKRLSDCLSLT